MKDFKLKVIKLLNSNHNFILFAARHSSEKISAIEASIDHMIKKTIDTISKLCTKNNKADEMLRIAKECTQLNFADENIYQDIIAKGKGANSEIFSINLVHVIEDIAARCSLKNSTVNIMMALVTPAILCELYKAESVKNDHLTPPQSSHL